MSQQSNNLGALGNSVDANYNPQSYLNPTYVGGVPTGQTGSADFYARLRSAVNVQPSNVYLNGNQDDMNEVAGLPVGGFVALIIGIVLCVCISLCLLRYLCFPRKFQSPDMGMGDTEMGMGGMSPKVDH